MAVNRSVRRVLLGIAVLLLVYVGWEGISGGIHQFSQHQTTGQKVQSAMQLAFGLFGVLSVVTVFWGRQWAPLMQVSWVVSVTLAAGLAAVVWGGTTLVIGLLTGAASLVLAWTTVWVLRVGTRGLTRV